MISEIFIERPKLAMVISIVIMIGGILCITKVPVAEYPEVTPPQINVSATYPGASAQVIADTVAAPIETEVNGVENMIYFSSQSDNSGNYSLDLTFEPGTDQDIAMVNVQNAVKVRKRSGDMLGVFVFTADEGTMSRLELSNYVARNVREPIARVPGVAQAYIFGELKYSMRIWLDPLKMSAMNISVDEVASAITSQNLQAAAGETSLSECYLLTESNLKYLGPITLENFVEIPEKGTLPEFKWYADQMLPEWKTWMPVLFRHKRTGTVLGSSLLTPFPDGGVLVSLDNPAKNEELQISSPRDIQLIFFNE